MSFRWDMRIQGGRKFGDLAGDLRRAGRKDLRKDLLRRIREEGKPVVADVRAAVRATPSRGVKGGGDAQRGGRDLRSAIAAATQVSVASSSANPRIRIRVSSRRLPAGQGTLPKYLDGEIARFARWRHPVFGNTSVWVTQPSHPFFFTTIRRHRDGFRRAVLKAIDDTIEELGRG